MAKIIKELKRLFIDFPGKISLLLIPLMFVLSDWGLTNCGASPIEYKLFRTYLALCAYYVLIRTIQEFLKYKRKNKHGKKKT